MRLRTVSTFLLFALTAVSAQGADTIDAALQAKIDKAKQDAITWAADPAVVSAVKDANANPPADAKAMTQDKWKALLITDPFVRGFSKNAAATFLKSKKSDTVSEAFLSAADGSKVAFLSKTTNWSHAGKPKHDDPMAGKTWQGAIEVDESTGVQQLQIAVPVKDGDKPIGSLVVGLNITKLKE